MIINKELKCEKCNGRDFEVKREVTYVYTYKIAHSAQNPDNSEGENLPFLFDNREKAHGSEYLICLGCGERYPCSLSEGDESVRLTILQKAVRADNVVNPEYLG